MASTGYLLSRLSAGTVRYGGVVGGGGRCEFDSADIAMALARVSDRAAYLLLLRWGGLLDDADERELVRLVLLKVVSLWSAPERWDVRRGRGESREQRVVDGGPIERMVRAAIAEAVDPAVCRVCHGAGVVFRRDGAGEGAVSEVRCDAAGCVDGRVGLSGRQRARRCGMSWEMYRRCWDARYERTVRLVGQLMCDGAMEFKQALGGGVE